MFCSQCGSRLADTHRFCAGCGAAVADGASSAREDTPTTVSPGPISNHIITAIQTDTTVGQRVSLSGAVLGLILFFLPWADVSCAGMSRSMSGYDLAANGSLLLWLVPLGLILTLVILYRVALARPKTPETPALQNIVIAGGFTGAAVMVLVYLSARSQLKNDPIFGQMADSMLSVRVPGALELAVTIASSVGGILHRNQGPAPQPAALPDIERP